jgi:hypothetical protein
MTSTIDGILLIGRPILVEHIEVPPGTTGFDVVGSRGWLRVEVPGGLVKLPGKK